MKSTSWKDIAELIGIAAIVASLVFVGLQMKQSQEIAVATQYQERTAISIESIVARSQLPNMAETTGARIKDEFARYVSDEMSNAEIGHKWFAARLSLASFDNAHFQWNAGYLDDEGWEMQRRTLGYLLHTEPMSRFLVEERRLYRQSFSALCRELISNSSATTANSE